MQSGTDALLGRQWVVQEVWTTQAELITSCALPKDCEDVVCCACKHASFYASLECQEKADSHILGSCLAKTALDCPLLERHSTNS